MAWWSVLASLQRRQYLVGVAVVFAFVVLPMAVQRALGWRDIAFIGAIVGFVPFVLTASFAWAERQRLGTSATVATAYGGAVVAAAATTAAWALLDPRLFEGTNLVSAGALGAYLGLLVIGLWAMVVLLPMAVRRERASQELRREVERARVRAAIEPHFVLNTLNAIAGLIGDAPETARDLVGDLGDLLRDAVVLAECHVQPAAAEVAWLQRYARILAARHQGRLDFEWSIDPAAGDRPIPVLLLQPLLENAIRHGALQRPGGGHVRVELAIIGVELRCVVEDDGPGLPAEVRDAARGLALTRRRLACDAPGSTLELTSTGAGTRAVVHLVPA